MSSFSLASFWQSITVKPETMQRLIAIRLGHPENLVTLADKHYYAMGYRDPLCFCTSADRSLPASLSDSLSGTLSGQHIGRAQLRPVCTPLDEAVSRAAVSARIGALPCRS